MASRQAAMVDRDADSSIGGINASNAVQCYLGLGLGWLIAALYHTYRGTTLEVTKVRLGFSLVLYMVLTVVAIIVLLFRRRNGLIGGELGGPPKAKYTSAYFFCILWIIYVTLATMESYCIFHVPYI